MTFSWWWIIVAIAAIWTLGWFVTTALQMVLDPLASPEERRKNWRERLPPFAIMNWFIWPWALSEFKWSHRFHRDIKTGKRPSWLIRGDGDRDRCGWKLSEGTDISGTADGGSSTEPSRIQADRPPEDTNPVEYRTRMIAPTLRAPTDWKRMPLSSDWPEPEPDEDEDEVEELEDEGDDDTWRFCDKVQLERGKYAVEFRVRNSAGGFEEFSGVIMIVSDPEDYE